jgi:hypothetical protein
VFINKRMLFKVEVTDANLYRNWRGYTVKKLSDDDDIIKRFAALHGIYVYFKYQPIIFYLLSSSLNNTD